MDWLFIPVTLPMWEMIFIGVYVLLAHTYVTFRLAKLLFFTTSKEQKVDHSQHNGVNNKVHNPSNNINPLSGTSNGMNDNVNNNSNNKSTDYPN